MTCTNSSCTVCPRTEARTYAGKYAAKPEKHFYLEVTRDSVRNFLQCRTIGVCIAHSRLLGFHVVRSTRPCILAMTSFVQPREYCCPRDDSHTAKWPAYPHPTLHLSRTQSFFFRNKKLRHMRLEQVARYYSTSSGMIRAEETIEDTMENDDDAVECDAHHRHYDAFSERTPPGQKFTSMGQGLETSQRRCQGRLAVNRIPYLEPLGGKRENYYEQKLSTYSPINSVCSSSVPFSTRIH